VNLHAKFLSSRWPLLAAVACAAILGALILLGVSTRKVLTESDQAVDRVRHIYEVLSEVATIRESTLLVESMVRGFVITGDRAMLGQHALVEQKRETALARLKVLTQDHAEQKTRLEGLVALIQSRRGLSAQIIATREMQGFEAASQLVMTAERSGTRVRYLNQLTKIQDAEQQLLTIRNQAHQAASAKTAQLNTLALVFMGGLLFVVFAVVGWHIKSRAGQLALEMENHDLAVEKKQLSKPL
jgi:CHASE3 domain sensor protein